MKPKPKQIFVEAATTQEKVLEHQCDVVNQMDTITDAKRYARWLLTDGFARGGEMTEPLRYSRVMVNGECLYDYFRK